MTKARRTLSKTFHAILFFVGLGTFVIHEFAHWVAGAALGHEMSASPNHVWARNPMPAVDQGIVAAAGPLITIAQGITGFWLVRCRRSAPGFALLYMAFFMRLVAAGVSSINPNDEAKVSQLLGLGTWTLPATVVTGLFILVVVASRKLHLKFGDQLSCFVLASVVISLVVGADAVFWK